MSERLQQRLDDIAWAGHGQHELRQAAQTLWKSTLWAHSDAARGRLISYAATAGTEHHCKLTKLLAVRRELPPTLADALDPLVDHHTAMHTAYTVLHSSLRVLDVLP
jgi:hypothetical protein